MLSLVKEENSIQRMRSLLHITKDKLSKHANIKVRVRAKDKKTGKIEYKLVETVVGRVIFNQSVPEETGFVDELLTKKKLQGIIADVYKTAGPAKAAKFLDDIKELGFQMAYKVAAFPWD
jgi:DNA-directed RNA polymerase subunit beta'